MAKQTERSERAKHSAASPRSSIMMSCRACTCGPQICNRRGAYDHFRVFRVQSLHTVQRGADTRLSRRPRRLNRGSPVRAERAHRLCAIACPLCQTKVSSARAPSPRARERGRLSSPARWSGLMQRDRRTVDAPSGAELAARPRGQCLGDPHLGGDRRSRPIGGGQVSLGGVLRFCRMGWAWAIDITIARYVHRSIRRGFARDTSIVRQDFGDDLSARRKSATHRLRRSSLADLRRAEHLCRMPIVSPRSIRYARERSPHCTGRRPPGSTHHARANRVSSSSSSCSRRRVSFKARVSSTPPQLSDD